MHDSLFFSFKLMWVKIHTWRARKWVKKIKSCKKNKTRKLHEKLNFSLEMELRGDSFYQKAIHCLARTLAKLDPTPEDKVFMRKLKILLCSEKINNVLEIKFSISTYSSSNCSSNAPRRVPAVFSASIREHTMPWLALDFIFSRVAISMKIWSFLIWFAFLKACRSQYTRKKTPKCWKKGLIVS